MEMMFTCFCGRSFIGTELDYDRHLKMDCPVYAFAAESLRKRGEERAAQIIKHYGA